MLAHLEAERDFIVSLMPWVEAMVERSTGTRKDVSERYRSRLKAKLKRLPPVIGESAAS